MGEESLIGMGLYTIPEAAKLTGIPNRRVRRWISGYTYSTGGQSLFSKPIWQSQLHEHLDVAGLGFLDLIELYFVNALREMKVPWSHIKNAAATARELYNHSHPFATKQFLIHTDGRNILGYIDESSGKKLIDLATKEYELQAMVEPSFVKSIDFDKTQAVRWWPDGIASNVFIDPKRSFGQPIVKERGIPTSVLYDSYRAEGTYVSVAKWYSVSSKSVKDAVKFEARLAA